MAENRLIEALNHSIDMLAEGKTVDECVSRYPQFADQLRGMLMTGQVTKRGKLPVHEVVAARTRIDPAIKSAIENFTPAATASGAAASTLPFSPLAMVASTVVVIVAVGLVILSSTGTGQFATSPSEMTLTVDASPEVQATATQDAATATIAPTDTSEAIQTEATTDTPEPVSTDTPEVEPTAVIVVPTDEPTSTATPPTYTVIVGPVQEIEDSTVTIFGFDFELEDDSPLLDQIREGDIVRLEVGDDAITLVIELPDPANGNGNNQGNGGQGTVPGSGNGNGQGNVPGSDNGSQSNGNGQPGSGSGGTDIWQDDGTCNNPPPDWAPARGWRERCEGGDSPGQGNNNPNSGSGNNQGQGQGSGQGQGQGSGQGQGQGGGKN